MNAVYKTLRLSDRGKWQLINFLWGNAKLRANFGAILPQILLQLV